MDEAQAVERDALRDEFSRTVLDQIAIADRAMSVADAIANAPPEEKVFGGLLYHLLSCQGDTIVLALSKVFDTPSRRFRTRSISAFLSVLRDRASELRVYSREPLEQFLSSRGQSRSSLPESDEALTLLFVEHYRQHLSGDDASPRVGSAALLQRVRTRRNKQVAHNEDWRPSPEEAASWEDLRELLNEAKSFAGLVGPAYLDMHFEANDGTYMLTKQSGMLGTQMSRLLKAAAAWLEAAMRVSSPSGTRS